MQTENTIMENIANYKKEYKQLRNNNQLDELEVLIRNRIVEYPSENEITKNQLVGLLLKRIESNLDTEILKQ